MSREPYNAAAVSEVSGNDSTPDQTVPLFGMTIVGEGARVNRKYRMAGPTIVRAVMSRIERGGLRPGERIMPQQLAQRLGTSSTPVREALCQLVGRDILIERHREGFYVASITSTTLRALYAAHGRVVATMLHRWHAGARLAESASNRWRLFSAIAAGVDDDALAGMERYLAGRLAVARKHEATHVVQDTVARDLIPALRAGDATTALEISRDFHQDCEIAASQIWQSMVER